VFACLWTQGLARPFVLSADHIGDQEGKHCLLQPGFGENMTKRATAKYKLDRRMGQNIWGRPKSPVNR
jgi:hypothetical protein